MERDCISTPQARETANFYTRMYAPGGHIFGGHSLCGSKGGDDFHFIGQSFDGEFEDGVSSRLCRIDRASGTIYRLNTEETRQLRLAPNGRVLAVAIANDALGLDRVEIWGEQGVELSASVSGRIEQIAWSVTGAQLLMVVAGTGADLAGIHGGFTQKAIQASAAWAPEVRRDEGGELWRSLWIWDLENPPRQVTQEPLNVWEASWCGPDQIAAIVSDHHSEGSWYCARLALVDAQTGGAETLHVPPDQMGEVRVSPEGGVIAFIRAFCSDRGIVYGELCLLELGDRSLRVADCQGVDITTVEWRSSSVLHLAGLRGHETVVLDHNLETGATAEIFASTEITQAGWKPHSTPLGDQDCLFLAEGYARAPFIAQVSPAGLTELASLAGPDTVAAMTKAGTMEPISWTAPDGLIIGGWIIRPDGPTEPTPLMVDIHGGPISAHRCRWMASMRSAPLLASQGWTVLMPNPRGSAGRGDAFARAVKGDMGGRDLLDILAGVEALVAQGLVDRSKVAMTGTSYGGFMSAWAPTQCDNFAAVAALSPVGDWYSQNRTSQIPEFDAIMLDASPWDAGGAYFERSPAFFRHRKRTPALVLAGGVDRSTPPAQAEECYNAALRSGSPAELVIYPKAGHSMRSYPEYFDSAARILNWVNHHVHPGSDVTDNGSRA